MKHQTEPFAFVEAGAAAAVADQRWSFGEEAEVAAAFGQRERSVVGAGQRSSSVADQTG